jgi:hypothetical protein
VPNPLTNWPTGLPRSMAGSGWRAQPSAARSSPQTFPFPASSRDWESWNGSAVGSRRVSDGTRTRDRLDHNQELYQLSYAHHAPPVRATFAI